jgi:HK97 gp10 family phage protein
VSDLRGVDKHLKHLTNMEQAKKVAVQALFVGADHLRADAVHSITEGSVSGQGHVPSKPGEPPKADTHQLDTSIITEPLPAGQAGYRVSANAPHAAALEFGTSKMAERPYMRPAAARSRPYILQLVATALKALNRKT